MKITPDILRETAIYVEHYMKEHFQPTILFHNYRHTVKVVRAADMLSMESGLDKKERVIVHLAAWFSNIGYKDDPANHEEYGAKHAKLFLDTKGLDKDDIELIQQCILATRDPQHPHTPTSRILCDAVLYHLSAPTYFEELGLLRKEWEATGSKMYTDDEWYQLNVDFLQNHFYFSPFARKNLEKEKRANLVKLKAQLAIIKHSGISLTQDSEEIDEERNLFDSKTKFDRGVETLFRTASHNHMQLSQMGDGKANILIGINTLILGILISAVATKLDTNPFLKIPTLMMICVNVTTIVLAVLSTRPKIMHGRFTPAQIISKEANLLFFGNFHNMPLMEYKSAVKEMMLDTEYLYESLIMDIYYMGLVLARKYRFITWAYSVFMVGLVVCMMAYVLSYFLIDVPPVKP